MIENPEQLLEQGHEIISPFLGERRGKLDEFIRDDMQQSVLLDYAINYGLRRDRRIREDLQKKFGTARSNKSKAKKRLNESLERFCGRYGIKPSIQLYFESSELRKRIMHFACCHNQCNTKSSSYIYLGKLKDMLGIASQSLCEKAKQIIPPCHLTFSVVHLRYLQKIEHVLRIGGPEEPMWFRKQGSIAVDFDAGRICHREELLSDLKNLVLGR